jgi:zinc metalloprotease ZmpB
MNTYFDERLSAEISVEGDVVRDLRFVGAAPGAAAVAAAKARTPLGLTQEFLRVYGSVFGLNDEAQKSLFQPVGEAIGLTGSEIRFLEEKVMFDSVTVAFDQAYGGIPVWRKGLSVEVNTSKQSIVRATSRYDPKIQLPNLTDRDLAFVKQVSSADLWERLRIGESSWVKDQGVQELTINSRRLFVYQYNSASTSGIHHSPDDFKEVSKFFPFEPSKSLSNGQYCVVVQVLFSLTGKKKQPFNFLCLIEVDTKSAVYVEALFDAATAMIFETDPMTQSWGVGSTATEATLDPFRTTVTLQGLTPPAMGVPWTFSGDRIQLSDFAGGSHAAPTELSGSFSYGSRTLNFAAANAYHLNERFFRLVESLGFTIATYFDGTTFPIQVDHYIGDFVNAFCYGNAMGNGIGNTRYALADANTASGFMSIAADWRVVLHELGGHGILYDHVSSANFGFSHSAGDSFAAILNDPRTSAVGADRFITFPFGFFTFPSFGNRRHDRTPASGWAWHGPNDVGGYSSEQILCSTHFRIYRSIGGDSGDVARREFAARSTVYLMLRAIGSLTPVTNPGTAEPYASALIAADLGDWTSEGLAGGAYGKVIRWAFEKQGLFQPPGTPTPIMTEGVAPNVDVYIDDGRHGEYPFQPVHWNNQKIWNRRAPDGGTVHEDPIAGIDNYAYVEIRNRGTQTATGVSVRGFHCNPGAGLVWPDDWQSMETASLSSPNVAPGGSQVIGPFTWIPSQVGHECMLMIVDAIGDPTNADLFTGGSDSISEWRLVPHDNNIGQRNVSPVPALRGAKYLVEYLKKRTFIIKNPFFKRARAELIIELPKFLTERRWGVNVKLASGHKFALGPGEGREVSLNLEIGQEFRSDEAPKLPEDRTILVHAKVGGMTVGGMSFIIDPTWNGETSVPPKDRMNRQIDRVLTDLAKFELPVKLKSVNFDLMVDPDNNES